MKYFLSVCFAFLLICPAMQVDAQTPPSFSSSDILLSLKKLNVLGSVLYVAAHPDDENTRLLTYFAKEKLYRTGYLSLTRGDGGQNLIGNEQGVELGLIRTQELLAARRMDGAEQFFSRAYDFGFSKSTEEALSTWNKDKILSDVVWVIRNFRPDIIVTRFPPDSRAGHGHHSASAVLAVEAFSAAADPARFPEQLAYVQPWQPKRVLWNAGFGGADGELFRLEVGMFNPVLGKSYGEIASESRSQHKSQGFGVARQRGSMTESFQTLKGEAPKTDLFDNVITGWERVAGGHDISRQIDRLVRDFSQFEPGKSVPGLVALHKTVSALEESYWKAQKLKEIARLVEACCGLWMEATSNDLAAVQTGTINVNLFLNNRNGNNIMLKRVVLNELDSVLNRPLEQNRNFTVARTFYVSDSIPVTQPYWLKQNMSPGSFTVNDQLLIGYPDVQPAFVAKFTLNIEGQDFEYAKPLMHKYTDPVKGELYEPVVVVPPVLITPGKNLLLSFDASGQQVPLNIHALKTIGRSAATVNVPAGWQAQQASIAVGDSLAKGGEADLTFQLRPVAVRKEAAGSRTSGASVSRPAMVVADGEEHNMVSAAVSVEGRKYASTMRTITYDHIPRITYFREPAVDIVTLDLKKAGKKIGYVEGAGDYVVNALQQMGYDVTLLSDADLHHENLLQYDAIITGVRAYNVRPSLGTYYNKLMKYVQDGGNLIVQYNTSSQIGPLRAKIGPYPFTISRTRVTDENAAMRILKPDHPALNFPNKISPRDFEHWVQERSIYHASNWDKRYETLFASHDPQEQDDEGSLITTKYGKGNFVYTGLVFYRQLPAGVPGAYRLLANLIALNKKDSAK